MEFDLNYQQRAALSHLLNHLSDTTSIMNWDKEKLFSSFREYNLNSNFSIDYSNYIRTLQRLPFSIKRDFVCRILNSWSSAGTGNRSTLYDTFQTLLYLKIETGVECVLFNNILNLSQYLGIISFSFEVSPESDNCVIRMYFDCPGVDQYDSTVRFFISSEYETPRVAYDVSAELLKRKMSFVTQPSREDVSQMLQALTVNNTKTHCPWIYLNYTLNCEYWGGFAPFVSIIYEDIQYVDCNGE